MYEATATHSGGDLRKAITLLQSAARLFGTNTVTGKDIVAVAGAIPDEDVAKLIELCGGGLSSSIRAHSLPS